MLSFRLPSYATWQRFNLKLFIAYALLHVSFFLAPFTWSLPGLVLGLVLYALTICGGITLCYHRLLAHRSYQTHKWLKYGLTFLGVLAFQRGPIWWTATHRLHHAEVDTSLDPHTPTVSFLWSHVLWPFFRHPQLDETPEPINRLARDLIQDPVMRFFEKHYTTINVGFLLLLWVIGYTIGGTALGLSFFVWAGILRLACTLHITWLVNSVAHLWGYRNYSTADTSRNNWWVALLTFGEGWHNNHHHAPRAARNGHKWFEIDITYYLILLLRQLGLASHVVPVNKQVKPSIYLPTNLAQASSR